MLQYYIKKMDFYMFMKQLQKMDVKKEIGENLLFICGIYYMKKWFIEN